MREIVERQAYHARRLWVKMSEKKKGRQQRRDHANGQDRAGVRILLTTDVAERSSAPQRMTRQKKR